MGQTYFDEAGNAVPVTFDNHAFDEPPEKETDAELLLRRGGHALKALALWLLRGGCGSRVECRQKSIALRAASLAYLVEPGARVGRLNELAKVTGVSAQNLSRCVRGLCKEFGIRSSHAPKTSATIGLDDQPEVAEGSE